MNRKLAQFILLIVFLAAAGIFLVQNGIPDDNRNLESQQPPGIQEFPSPIYQATQSARATATYGAQQFYLQLTAVAGDQ